MVPFYIDQVKSVLITEIDEREVSSVNEYYKNDDRVSCIAMDITSEEYSNHMSMYDTVMCINCLEHIENHQKALNNMKHMLKNGGNLIIFVPAMMKLYNNFDRNVGHYRRYEPGELNNLGKSIGLEVIKNIHFNFCGMIVYKLKGLQCQPGSSFNKGDGIGTHLDSSNGFLINLASAICEPIEKLLPPKIGLSELIVYRRVDDIKI